MNKPNSHKDSTVKKLPKDGLGDEMLGTRDTEAKELSRAEFLRVARSLQFNERELAALRVLYGNTIENTAKLDNFEPSIQY